MIRRRLATLNSAKSPYMFGESGTKLSPVERGVDRWRPSFQPGTRTLAVIGFCCAATILIYHLPFNWLGIVGASTAHLPTYMWPG